MTSSLIVGDNQKTTSRDASARDSNSGEGQGMAQSYIRNDFFLGFVWMLTELFLIQNGVGAFILQCRRLDFHYCDWAGSSRGMLYVLFLLISISATISDSVFQCLPQTLPPLLCKGQSSDRDPSLATTAQAPRHQGALHQWQGEGHLCPKPRA